MESKAGEVMCGLCGLFGEKSHWSTQGVDKGTSSRQRFFRSKALNRVLGVVRYRVRDFAGSQYTLRSPTGAGRVITEMGQLWQELENLRGAPLDPLDESVMSAIMEHDACV